MKHIIEFNYPEDKELLSLYQKGPEAIWLLDSLQEKLRHDLKHRDDVYEKLKGSDYINEFLNWLDDEISERNLGEVL